MLEKEAESAKEFPADDGIDKNVDGTDRVGIEDDLVARTAVLFHLLLLDISYTGVRDQGALETNSLGQKDRILPRS